MDSVKKTNPAGGPAKKVTPEQVRQIADQIYARLLAELRAERQRQGARWQGGRRPGGWGGR
jgi:hypothetical protein